MSSECYVFAIVGRETPLPEATPGGGVAELTMVSWGELAAVTGRMRSDEAALTVESVLRHEAVVEAARRHGPALPVRFGTVFRDPESVARALAERYEPLVADLERLGNRVEFSLTALWAAPPFDDVQPVAGGEEGGARGRGAGARYLYARAAEARRDDAARERAREVARDLEQGVGAQALERRVTLLPTPRIAVRVAYLLDPAMEEDFREAFGSMRRSRGDLRLLLTGPWPPYSFVTRTEAEGGGGGGLDGRMQALVQFLTDEMRGRPG